MVTIRLQRRGRKKRPIHHIVVADSRSPRDGRIVEDLGRFNNLTINNEVNLNEERAIYWLKQGAKPSDTVRSILKKQGIMYKMHLMRWGKSEEEIEEALNEWREKRAEKEEKEPSKKERQRAMLEAEEKEYQKQLKKKAEEAAKEKAKREALAKEKEEKEAVEAAEEEAEDQTDEEKKAEESDEEVEAKTTDASEEEVEAQAEEVEEAEVKTTQSGELAAGPEDTETEQNEAEPEEEKQETAEKDQDKEEADVQVSTDMLAKEAIEHIENTPANELKDFISDDEDRVTVRRAWEEKQEG